MAMVNREFLGGPIDGECRCLPEDITSMDVYTDKRTGLVEWGLSICPPVSYSQRWTKDINVDRYTRPLAGERFLHAGRVVDGQLVIGKGVQGDKG